MTPSSTNRDDLDRVLEALEEGTFSGVAVQHLHHRLSSEPEYRKRFLRRAALHGHLRMEGALLEGEISGSADFSFLPAHSSVLPRPRRGQQVGIAFSAAVAILAVLVLVFHDPAIPSPGKPLGDQMVNSTAGSGDSSSLRAHTIAGGTSSAARFSRSVNVRWSAGAPRWSVGDILHDQDIIRLEEGRVEIVFDSGAVMSLVGPAALDIQSSLVATLHSGTATTRVANVTSGDFKVVTSTTEVLDLGTEFGVRVNPGREETDVVVFDGAVDLASVADKAVRTGVCPAPRRLSVGEAVRVGEAGVWKRLVSVDSDAFPFGDRMFDVVHTRKPIIASVSDNLSQESRPKFYAIVPEGFGEDVKAFVDRPHEWNGVDDAGLPPELVGGDYIRTFMEDKISEEMAITVTLTGPAHLYVLFDDRVPVPDWLSSDFEDTLLDVGVDEGDYVAPFRGMIRQPLDVGPGRSIENRFSVWKRTLRHDPTAVLGSVPRGVGTGVSIYGIVAVPISDEL